MCVVKRYWFIGLVIGLKPISVSFLGLVRLSYNITEREEDQQTQDMREKLLLILLIVIYMSKLSCLNECHFIQ